MSTQLIILKTFRHDGTIKKIEKSAKETGKPTKITWYRSDGKTVSCIWECDQETGKPTKDTNYNPDGKTVSSISEYHKDQETGNLIKKTFCKGNNKIKENK